MESFAVENRKLFGFVAMSVMCVACGSSGGGSPTVPTGTTMPVTTLVNAPTLDSSSPYGVCAVTAASATQRPDLTVQVIPEGDPLYGLFTKCIKTFGVSHVATDAFSDEKLQHVATITAEYLDNDEDGVPDDLATNSALERAYATMWLTRDDAEYEAIRRMSDNTAGDIKPMDYSTAGQLQYPDETNAGGTLCGSDCGTLPDASLEEVLHLLQKGGYAVAYPDLGGVPTTLLTEAMDIARGGKFDTTPAAYPEEAWYHYNDSTCIYECMAIEYFYWGLTTYLGAQGDLNPIRCRHIEDEWEPCTKAQFQATDTKLYDLVTNPMYNLPTVMPDGRY